MTVEHSGASNSFVATCRDLRGRLDTMEGDVRRLMEHPVFYEEQERPNQHGEMKANVMLAVRHIEDARMRMGKALQHAEDGVSVYDGGKRRDLPA